MRDEYDFSKARKSPYASLLKKQITIRLDEDAIAYFKGISEELGIPYQSLINLYLRDCAVTRRRPNLSWMTPAVGEAREGGARFTAGSIDRSTDGANKTIIDAIHRKQALAFAYNGRRRTVEPQCFGLGNKGNALLIGRQIQGRAKQEILLFDVSKIKDLVALDQYFEASATKRVKGHAEMKVVLAEV
ncbi:MAG TPA: BrnA antitoxin family protein [Albitalea sp.]|uniref:BrnA antitoxin family protein n=1 Tax=Piscinibacter sp. TaxID=1903157 RepID=UPI002ED22E73